jgi:acyl carrier protein phosphodiesterase
VNFLAHLYIAADDPLALIGAVLPDLTRGRLPTPPAIPAAMYAAARQHQRVDAITDTHPVASRSRARLRPTQGRYAGILADIFFDHILLNTWDHWCDEPIAAFLDRVHDAFHRQAHRAPPSVRGLLPRLIDEGWLVGNATPAGVARTLRRVSRRLRERFDRTVDLEPAVADLVRLNADLTADFMIFFPDLLGQLQRPLRKEALTCSIA